MDHLSELVGPELVEKAHDVLDIKFTEWTTKSTVYWGAPTSMGPKLLSKSGDELRKPILDIHLRVESSHCCPCGHQATEEKRKALQPEAKL